ncbi:hypothetical protein LTR86_004088 [Recurvomyces mirabilis]|nr:hypothetical protein LTR86_004088 [Recurvomyces mirabilis]
MSYRAYLNAIGSWTATHKPLSDQPPYNCPTTSGQATAATSTNPNDQTFDSDFQVDLCASTLNVHDTSASAFLADLQCTWPAWDVSNMEHAKEEIQSLHHRGSHALHPSATSRIVLWAPCALCGAIAKNESHAKRHAYRHTKPFACPQVDCALQQGFGTNLDMERHRKSVHNAVPLVGSSKRYQCCVPGCPRADRIWSRLDHFRLHVRRLHGEYDVDAVIVRSKV